jgi:soluble lytic murein transglycosylase-like protein
MNFTCSLWVAVLPAATLFYSQAHAFCFEEAGAMYGVSPSLLKAVATVESSLKPYALNRGHTQKTRSIDIGLMQINSRWLLAEPFHSLGYQEAHLLDPCTNVKVGAWVLANSFKVHGNTWEAVGAYNAACTQLKGEACVRARTTYEWKVYRAMRKAV